MIILSIVFLAFFASTSARLPLDLSKCASTGTIIDRNGKVVKNACQVAILPTPTYAQSVTVCANLGMDLIYAEDAYVYNSLMQWINSTFYVHPCTANWFTGCGVWFNGEKALDGYWYATIDGLKVKMDTSFYNSVSNPAYGYYDPGNCMATKNQNGFGQTPWNCNQPYGPICEYNNVYVPPCKVSNQGSRYYNIAKCTSVGTIRDDCGNVVKGVCEIRGPFTQEGAEQACQVQGMDLFVAENVKIMNEFMKFIEARYYNDACNPIWGTPCGLWVGGKFNTTSTTWSKVRDWSTLTMNIDPYNSWFTTSSSPGNCIAVKNVNAFKVAKFDCNQAFDAICAFDSKI